MVATSCKPTTRPSYMLGTGRNCRCMHIIVTWRIRLNDPNLKFVIQIGEILGGDKLKASHIIIFVASSCHSNCILYHTQINNLPVFSIFRQTVYWQSTHYNYIESQVRTSTSTHVSSTSTSTSTSVPSTSTSPSTWKWYLSTDQVPVQVPSRPTTTLTFIFDPNYVTEISFHQQTVEFGPTHILHRSTSLLNVY